MARADEAFQVINQGAGTYGPFFAEGGMYQLAAHATWGGGSLTLQQLLPDGQTYLSLFGQPNTATPTTWVATLAADGTLTFFLPRGQYQLVFATGSALYASLARIPGE